MPAIQFTKVITFSSEDPNHPAENLLRPDTFRKWKCASGTTEKQSSVTLKLEKMSPVHSIDIGNEGSAFVEVLAGREGAEAFQVLLVASSFMTPIESRNGTDLNRVRMFGPDKLNKNVAGQKWDRLKVICTQPFNKQMQYGLSFIKVRSPNSDSSPLPAKITKLGSFTLKEEDADPISVGSLFARRKDKEPSSPLSGAAAIRAASAEAVASVSSPGTHKRKSQDPSPDVGFYQLKKKIISEPDPVKTPTVAKLVKPPSASGSHKKNHNDVKEKNKHDMDGQQNGKREAKHRSSETAEREGKCRKNKNINFKEETKTDRASTAKSPTSILLPVKKKFKPFSSLMDDVFFVMSGYQNPQRSQLRDMMVDMGAKYKSDWDPKCTHLICAFTNTPKYQQVKGHGKIVTAKWITDCHNKKIRYPCKRYSLEKGRDQTESEEEIWADELLPKESKPAVNPSPHASAAASAGDEIGSDISTDMSDNEDTDDEIQRVLARQKITTEDSTSKKTNNLHSTKPDTPSKMEGKDKSSTENAKKDKQAAAVNNAKKNLKADGTAAVSNGTAVSSEDEVYDDDTDVDEENLKYLKSPDTSALPLPTLGDYFKGKCFFIHGKMAEENKRLLRRYIIAFNGDLEDYMSEKVQFVITKDNWDESFDEALNENPSLQFVKPLWIWRCSDKQRLVPHQPFLIVPTE